MHITADSEVCYVLHASELDKIKTYKTLRGVLAYAKKKELSLLELESHHATKTAETAKVACSSFNPLSELSPNPANSETYSKISAVYIDCQFLLTRAKGFEMISLAVVDENQKILYSSLFKPKIAITSENRKQLGSYLNAVQKAPSFADEYNKIQKIVKDKHLYVWGRFKQGHIANEIRNAFEFTKPLRLQDIWKNPVTCLYEEYYRPWLNAHGYYQECIVDLEQVCKEQRIEHQKQIHLADSVTRAKILSKLHRQMKAINQKSA